MDISSQEKAVIITTRIALCFPFAVVGIFGFYYFLEQDNFNASIWSLFLAILCAVVMRMNIYYIWKRLLPVYDDTLRVILRIISWISAVASGVATSAYITLGASQHQDFQVDGYGYYPAALAAFFTFIWAVVWYWDMKKFQKLLVDAQPLRPIGGLVQSYQAA